MAGEPVSIPWRARRRDGSVFWAEVNLRRAEVAGAPHVLATVRDVSERRQAEQQRLELERRLAAAQRLESIGRLAGGIAHDFNNLLTAIRGQVALALMDLPSEHPLHEGLQEIDRAVTSAAGLTRQMLAFSRVQPLDPIVLDLGERLRHAERMLRRLIGEDVDLRTDLAAAPLHVRADPGQLEQVIVNLVVNARDAMPQGGVLTLRTYSTQLDEAACHDLSGVHPGPFAALEVIDNGIGMTEEVRRQVFEPFFTTKEMGRGTGLGLATVHGIVRQSGGVVTAESAVGRGSTFRVLLPIVDRPLDALAPPSTPLTRCGQGERILLVEDDDAVRRPAAVALRRAGFAVETYSSGADALAALGEGAPPRVLVTDVVMPGMSGRELVERVATQFPRLPVLFTSGYPADHLDHKVGLPASSTVLPKPYSPDQLVAAVLRLV